MDPNRDGYISLQEYMAFMISKETENVQSSEEIEHAFRAITSGERPYVLKEELYTVSRLPPPPPRRVIPAAISEAVISVLSCGPSAEWLISWRSI